MTELFLLMLAGAWLVILGPALVKARRNAPLSTASLFKRRMSLIAPAARSGRWILTPRSSAATDRAARRSKRRAQRRRKQTLIALLLAAPLSALAAVWRGGDLWALHFAADAALVGFVGLLRVVESRRRTDAKRVETRARRAPLVSFPETFHETVPEAVYEERRA